MNHEHNMMHQLSRLLTQSMIYSVYNIFGGIMVSVVQHKTEGNDTKP
jgi:hypothetical protein